MFQQLKKRWRALRAAPPGKRFRLRYESRKKEGGSGMSRALYLVVGSLVLLAGILLMPAPGPGLIVVAVGAALVAQESYLAARALDWLEVRLRKLWASIARRWKRTPLALKGIVVAFAAMAAGLAGWGAYAVLLE